MIGGQWKSSPAEAVALYAMTHCSILGADSKPWSGRMLEGVDLIALCPTAWPERSADPSNPSANAARNSRPVFVAGILDEDVDSFRILACMHWKMKDRVETVRGRSSNRE